MATIAQIRAMLESGETVSLKRRYVAPVLEGLAATGHGTEQFKVVPRARGMNDIALERACRHCYGVYTGPICACEEPAV